MLILYPPIKPYKSHSLEIDDHHIIYFDESGNSEGIPVIFLHGGPGGGCSDHGRRYFDPNFYHIISLDQRGCGQSTPHGSLYKNTTEDLVLDLEKVRSYLKIGRWMLLGGGWGGTLALLYAQNYPDKVLAVIAASLSLGRQSDLNWKYRDGMRRIFPDYWKEFTENLLIEERADPLLAYHKHLNTDKNEVGRMLLAKSWGLWVMRCSTLRPNQEAIDCYQDSHRALAMAKISSHFAINNFFIEENQILNNINKIKHIPGILVHGRYDMVSPVDGTFQLNQHWHAAEHYIVRDAGHLLVEPGIQDALVRATSVMAKRFKNEFNLGKIS